MKCISLNLHESLCNYEVFMRLTVVGKPVQGHRRGDVCGRHNRKTSSGRSEEQRAGEQIQNPGKFLETRKSRIGREIQSGKQTAFNYQQS